MGAGCTRESPWSPCGQAVRVSARVSVLIGVRNTPWLRGALDTLCWQTFRDFETIVVDDGSDIITQLCLEEAGAEFAQVGLGLVIIRKDRSEGLTRALIDAAEVAGGDFLARLDADDTAWPERFAHQVAFLDRHPEVGVLGTWGYLFDEVGRPLMSLQPPTDHAMIRDHLRSYNPLIHSSVMMRRAVYDAAGGYDPTFQMAQDYDLWLRLRWQTRFAVLPEILMTRRLHPFMQSIVRAQERRRSEARARWRAWRRGDFRWWELPWTAKPMLAVAWHAGREWP